MNRIFQRVRNRIFRDIYQSSFWRFQAELAYKAALEKHIGNLPVLSPNDLTVVETLRREGVFVTSLQALSIPSSPRMLIAAKKLIPQIPKTISKKNEFVVHASSQQIMEYPEIFLWGLEQRLINIVENYIGLPVAYHGAYFRRDIVNKVQKRTRLWHKDVEDSQYVKIIVYLNDVNDDGGPFQYLPKCLSSTVCRYLKYKYGHIQDKVMEQVVHPSNWKSCTGSAGTVIFAVTGSILHRGKLPVASDRFSIFFDYTSRQPIFPFYCKSSLPKQDLLLLARKLSEGQRQCVFWRKESLQECQFLSNWESPNG